MGKMRIYKPCDALTTLPPRRWQNLEVVPLSAISRGTTNILKLPRARFSRYLDVVNTAISN